MSITWFQKAANLGRCPFSGKTAVARKLKFKTVARSVVIFGEERDQNALSVFHRAHYTHCNVTGVSRCLHPSWTRPWKEDLPVQYSTPLRRERPSSMLTSWRKCSAESSTSRYVRYLTIDTNRCILTIDMETDHKYMCRCAVWKTMTTASSGWWSPWPARLEMATLPKTVSLSWRECQQPETSSPVTSSGKQGLSRITVLQSTAVWAIGNHTFTHHLCSTTNRYAVFGLGSSAYVTYCAFAKAIDQQMSDMGMEQILPVHTGDAKKNQDSSFK